MCNAFLFNFKHYSSEVINIQRRKVELNIVLPRVNNFDIKQKKGMKYLFHYILPTPNKIWEDKDKTQQTSVKTQVFFHEN